MSTPQLALILHLNGPTPPVACPSPPSKSRGSISLAARCQNRRYLSSRQRQSANRAESGMEEAGSSSAN
ncbi:hypothetical protein M407DRAFT_34475 [Tulasnella calospora MUT 4182]|uniref:Uncharacterized protein n=1 Tax=Tulasnella calospora MUT 4182 TaxID=1051891 RepID=A0A0C3Q188_9AGAM|nr:hypothetical protein M407DRAFT_34475 [Tulasnella calospora MUT 4182]